MKTKIKILVVGFILISIFGGYIPAASAAETTSKPECVSEMKKFMEPKSTELRTYFKEHFQSKKTNSSLLDLALLRFDKYKKDLIEKLIELSPREGLTLYGETGQNLNCTKLMNDEIELMEKLLRTYFEQTAQVKKTSALMNKLKAINKKMDGLLKAVLDMYGKWLTLKGRVPCLLKQCL